MCMNAEAEYEFTKFLNRGRYKDLPEDMKLKIIKEVKYAYELGVNDGEINMLQKWKSSDAVSYEDGRKLGFKEGYNQAMNEVGEDMAGEDL